MMRALSISLFLSTCLATSLTAQTVKTILNNGPVNNRYDIVILGDGYQAAEQGKFDTDCLASINYLFGRPSYGAYKKFFNVHTVFRASVDSGADEPDKSPPIVKNTVYDSTFNYGGTPRCLYIKNTAQAAADGALAPDVEGRIIVLVNTTRYGGCAATYAVSYTGSSGPQVQAHEFGHSFGRLADEYDYGKTGTYTGPEPAQPNVTKDSTGMAKWPLWVGFNGIGAFEGAKYYKKGLYRPKSNCMMRANGIPLCEICNEAIVKQAYVTVNPIENKSPATSTLSVTKPQTQVFSFDSLVPAASSITWTIDGNTVATGSSTFSWDTSSYAVGSHTVKVTLEDLTTFVRSDPTDLLTSSETWTVDLKPGSNKNCELVYYNFDNGAGATAVNRATSTDTPMSGTDPWTNPGRYGNAMLKGQPNTSTAWAESEFKGPITGDLSIHWWMKERVSPGTGLSYLLGGLGSFRGFTGGVAGKEFWLRAWGGTDLKLPTVGADLQTRAQGANGVCVTLTIDGTANVAQWYIDGAAHGAAITITTGANVAAVANGFRVGKHSSDSTSSRYDLDEFRMVNRVATTDEITSWVAGPKSLYYKFDRGMESLAINYGDDPAPSMMVTAGGGTWQSPGRYGPSMLRGSQNNSSAAYNYCDTGFTGPVHGGATIAWWMKERNSPGTGLAYLWGGIGSTRCFTGGVANKGLYVRVFAGIDIVYPGDIQAAAAGANGVHVALTIDAVGKSARWYINGAPDGAAITLPGGATVAASASSFKIGKHTSNSSSSCYDLDEFRLENRCAKAAEIKIWSVGATADVGLFAKRCGLALGTLGGAPTVGNSDYTHTIFATPAVTTSCLFVVGVLPSPSFDMGIAFPTLAGCRWFPSFDIQVAVPAAGGSVVIPGGVPNNAALAGLHIISQVLGVQGGTILQSNAASHVIEIN